MIENIRKYTGLIFVVIVVLLAGFILMDAQSFLSSRPTGNSVISVDGVSYSQNDFAIKAQAPLRLIPSLGDRTMYGFLSNLTSQSMVTGSEDEALKQFFVGRLVISEAREKFGIHPSDEEVNEFIRNITRFQTRPPVGSPPGTKGDFDQAIYNEFVEKDLSRVGLSERQFQDLVRDAIASEKLQEIIAGGLPGFRHLAEASNASQRQKIVAHVADIDAQPIRENIKPTDEELTEFWETRKDSFKTEKRIKMTYILASPNYADEAKPEPIDMESATDEEKKAYEDALKKYEEAQKPKDLDSEKATDEEKQQYADDLKAYEAMRKEAENQLTNDVSDLLEQIDESSGEDFEKVAVEKGWDIRTTDWFSSNTLPPDFQLRTRATSAGDSISNEVFNLTMSDDPLSRFTEAIAVGKQEWFFGRLDDAEEVREKTFDEAKEEVTEQYVDNKLNESLEAEVEAKTEAIKEAMEAGDSFADAAKKAELEPRKLGPWGFTDPLDNEFNARDIFMLASSTAPGEMADPFYSDDRAVIIFVESRQIEKDDSRGMQIDQTMAQLEFANERAAYLSWIDEAINDKEVETAR